MYTSINRNFTLLPITVWAVTSMIAMQSELTCFLFFLLTLY